MSLNRFFAIPTLALLAGCASGASSHNITASIQHALAAKPNSTFYQSMIAADITGGNVANFLLMPQASNGDLKQAFKGSLNHNALHVIGIEKYKVSAKILALDQPVLGLDLSVASKARYKVIRTLEKAVVFNKVLTQANTAVFGDSVLAVERLRLRQRRFHQKNIMSFISEISKHSA